MMKKTIAIFLSIFSAVILIAVFAFLSGYKKKTNVLEYDGAYYWNKTEVPIGSWKFVETPAGWSYYLYLPPNYDYENDKAKIPMVVTFHGQSGKYASVGRQGRIFRDEGFQKRSGGCAVLVLMARIDYFSDPLSAAKLIKNILIKYPALNPERVAGYGFSQGAMFVVNLAIADPSLFSAVISGSGYYEITFSELMRVRSVQFFTANSENDMGIFEHGSKTGRRLASWCKNSRYVQYKTRGHFALEMMDKSGKENETVESWLLNILLKK